MKTQHELEIETDSLPGYADETQRVRIGFFWYGEQNSTTGEAIPWHVYRRVGDRWESYGDASIWAWTDAYAAENFDAFRRCALGL